MKQVTGTAKSRVELPQGARFLVTGAAGFIGSSLTETLLEYGHFVRGLDNLSTGKQANVDELSEMAQREQVEGRFEFQLGDIRDPVACAKAMDGVDFVLHQAALGSVPRSIEDPATSNAVNVDGTLNVLAAARDAGVKRVVYASSSSVYGDHPALCKVEDETGLPMSPYAVTKAVNELYAHVFQSVYKLPVVGMRYFNVFGKRQDTESAYAAVIPCFVSALLAGKRPVIFGDGEQTRDFTYVGNVVQANLRAVVAPESATGTAYNVGCGETTTVNALFKRLRALLGERRPEVLDIEPEYRPERAGDVRQSLADIGRAQRALGYLVEDHVESGLARAIDWYRDHL